MFTLERFTAVTKFTYLGKIFSSANTADTPVNGAENNKKFTVVKLLTTLLKGMVVPVPEIKMADISAYGDMFHNTTGVQISLASDVAKHSISTACAKRWIYYIYITEGEKSCISILFNFLSPQILYCPVFPVRFVLP